MDVLASVEVQSAKSAEMVDLGPQIRTADSI